MAEIKTKVNDASVEAFLNSVEDEQRRKDSFTTLELMEKITGEQPKMWGANIIGFGSYSYKNAKGEENEWMSAGFSPRKQALTVYILCGFKKYGDQLEKLGKHKHSKSCPYINKLEDVDKKVLAEMVKDSYERVDKIGTEDCDY